MGKRKHGHGSGTWQFPGGHLEFNETIEDCARREVLEETGVRIKSLRLGPYTNDMFVKEQKHYITLFVLAQYASGVLQVREPEKCERWEWLVWPPDSRPLFLPARNLLKKNFNPLNMHMT
jgi:8-oxo-dGTP diphosphatase